MAGWDVKYRYARKFILGNIGVVRAVEGVDFYNTIVIFLLCIRIYNEFPAFNLAYYSERLSVELDHFYPIIGMSLAKNQSTKRNIGYHPSGNK